MSKPTIVGVIIGQCKGSGRGGEGTVCDREVICNLGRVGTKTPGPSNTIESERGKFVCAGQGAVDGMASSYGIQSDKS